MAIFAAVLVASLFGSLHCAGMCGPLVVFAMGSTEAQSLGSRLLVQVAYHGGRLATYALVGAVCGLVGAALDLGGALVGLHRVAALLAGGMMVLVGLVAVLRYAGVRMPHVPAPPFLLRIVQWGQRAAIGLQPVPRSLVIGLLTAFLPCGWLYAFAIIAAGTASGLWGAAVMVAFWLGTVPVLASLGVGVQAVTGTVGRKIPLITALVVVVLGLYTIAGRMTIPAHAFEKPLAKDAESTTLDQVKAASETPPPCCHEKVQAID
jgi:sulfite exporter TauE/SafE